MVRGKGILKEEVAGRVVGVDPRFARAEQSFPSAQSGLAGKVSPLKLLPIVIGFTDVAVAGVNDLLRILGNASSQPVNDKKCRSRLKDGRRQPRSPVPSCAKMEPPMNLTLIGEVRVILWGDVFRRGFLGWRSVNELHRPTAPWTVIRPFHVRHTA